MHLQVTTAAAIAPGATGAAGIPLTGDSLTVQNSKSGSGVKILAAWQTNQVAGFGQIAFPSGHDTTRGYRVGAPIGINPAFLPFGVEMEVNPQELLAVTLAGSAVAGDVEQMSLLLRYGDMPGIAGRYMSARELEAKTSKLTTIEQSITSVAGPGYSGEVAINTTTDLLLANRDYAIIGMSSRTAVHAMTLRGPDLGNVRIATPGILRQEITAQYFALLSRTHGEECIPVINSGNKAATFVGVATDENAGTFLVTLYMALLK
jgi:hypothetical protein